MAESLKEFIFGLAEAEKRAELSETIRRLTPMEAWDMAVEWVNSHVQTTSKQKTEKSQK